jgi:hypothetical protein
VLQFELHSAIAPVRPAAAEHHGWLASPLALASWPGTSLLLPARDAAGHDMDPLARWRRDGGDLAARPRTSWTVLLDHGYATELDTSRIYTDHHQAIPTFPRWDLRIGYRPNDSIEISVAVQDIVDPYRPDVFLHEDTDRGVRLLVAHRF